MTNKITSLTEKQKAKMPEHAEKWIKIGLCTDPANFERAEVGVRGCYRVSRLTEPHEILHCSSPLHTVIDGCTRNFQLANPEADWEAPDFKSACNDYVRSAYHNYRGGCLWASWYAFVSFFRDHCGFEHESLEAFSYDEMLALNCGWVWFGEHCAAICDRPAEIHLQENVLHKDDGPSISWRDGFSLYHLNGVMVPDWLAITPGEQLDPLKVMDIDNVEVRREAVRKIGVERLMFKLKSKVLDKSGSYELHEIDMKLPRLSVALKMMNPSVPELWHVEFVDNKCRTVQDALNFRNGLTTDMIDDKNGVDWYQQGDVIMRPRGARKFKSRPIKLT